MKELLFSGVQPTNNLHLGNYIGALKQWVSLQHTYPCLFSVVDLHAITVPQNPRDLQERVLDTAATYLAIGIDPVRSPIFIQSEVSAHTELAWILNTIAKTGELERMTQYKDKSAKDGVNASLGLYSYPVLMAADILLYDTTVVPVGEDQMQHVELTRVLARRFNERYGETFVVPKSLIQKQGARIMGLDDPEKKMSKSALSSYNFISLMDDAETIQKKVSKAVTDAEAEIVYNEAKKPAISNLLTIYHHMTGETVAELEERYKGKGYGDFKKGLAEAIIAHIGPVTAKIKAYREDPAELMKILDQGRDRANEMAERKLVLVKEKVGLGRK